MIRLAVRFTALAWLLAVAPLELATAMTGLLRAGDAPLMWMAYAAAAAVVIAAASAAPAMPRREPH
jgi:hypothetical protein